MHQSAKKIAQNLVNRLYDDITARDIKSALKRNMGISDSTTISVAVEKGTVTLSGAVLTVFECITAQETARATVGVIDVKNSLHTKQSVSRLPENEHRHLPALLRSTAAQNI
jgi:osmotically-inducible protein OsmY